MEIIEEYLEESLEYCLEKFPNIPEGILAGSITERISYKYLEKILQISLIIKKKIGGIFGRFPGEILQTIFIVISGGIFEEFKYIFLKRRI